jgi:hypothetical protein
MSTPTCGWCGHNNDCQPATPGKSPHHFLCCLDRGSNCLRTERAVLVQIMRDDNKREAAS